MVRTAVACTVFVAVAVPCWGDETAPAQETLIRLNVFAAAPPRPALRYLLLPEVKEMAPGNPIQTYYKCCLQQQHFLFHKEAYERRALLLAMPLKELPAQELADDGRYALNQVDMAARLDNPDWQILPKVKTDGFALLLPDVQEFRGLGQALQVRFRAEVALNRVDDALRTAKTMLALSRHLGEQPTLIGSLVGIAIATYAISPLEELLERPGCPNLYWALTNLPSPLVSLRKGMEGERALVLADFHDLSDTEAMTPEQLKKFVVHMDLLLSGGKPVKPEESLVWAWVNARIKKPEVLAATRQRLVEMGFPEQLLGRFPAEQIVLLDEKREYEVRRDEIMKVTDQPAWKVEQQRTLSKANQEPTLFNPLIEGLETIHRAPARLAQRIALLRHVEALRMYAAEHNGALPANLSEITVLLPDDPFTGKPFRYDVIGTTAHLRGSPPAGQEREAVFNVHYEVTIAN
jgi:hypothetical protein